MNDSICLFPTLRLDRFGFGDAQILTLQGKVLSICYNWNLSTNINGCINPYYLSWSHGWRVRGKQSNKRIVFKYREYKNNEDNKGIKRKSVYKIIELSEYKLKLVKIS
ncbi:MAG: hypothetical protein HYR91_00785 [Flavobacteriia bacterium]|nr:hypothetical protein [Flavobacteriia bacterium]